MKGKIKTFHAFNFFSWNIPGSYQLPEIPFDTKAYLRKISVRSAVPKGGAVMKPMTKAWQTLPGSPEAGKI